MLASLAAASRFARARTPAPSADGGLGTLWSVPEFSLADQHGARVRKSDLAGHVWIADFMFTRCTSVCPMLTARLRLEQRRLIDPSLRFVSFSVDPEHDTTEELRRYAETWGNDQRWLLLRTEPHSLQALVDGMRVLAQSSGDPENPILHTSLFFLVDRAGELRGMYDSNDELALARLVDDARALASGTDTEPRASESAESGRAEFEQLGCAGCHDNPRLAPALEGLWGSVRHAGRRPYRASGRRLHSRVHPRARRQAGVRLSRHHAVLRWRPVRSAAGCARESGAHPGGAREPGDRCHWRKLAAAVARDPVCGMSVRVTTETPHAARDGHEFYFCSEHCKAQFLGAPAALDRIHFTRH